MAPDRDGMEGIDARLRALAGRYGLGPVAQRQLGALLSTLTANALAPTSVTDPARALDDHIADSLVALELEVTRDAGDIADVGAGAGFPGLPLAVARPDARLVLIESNNRKCEFITGAARGSSIENATTVHARVEAWPDGHGRFDLVTARALAPLSVVVEYAAPLLKIGGTLIAWRGKRDEPEEEAAARAAAELGLEPQEPVRVSPYPQARNRHLHPMLKTWPTPARFPRRPGLARKRPLGVRRASSSVASASSSDREQR
jgi:16S rRNA (guanine527-N7)-methyltransferase